MSIRNLENSKIMQKYCKKLGRAGVAEKIIEICKATVEKCVLKCNEIIKNKFYNFKKCWYYTEAK